jgi:hypothetical protein
LTSASSAASDILVQTAGPSGGNNGLTAVPSGGNNGLTAVPSGENNGLTAAVSTGEQTPAVSRNISDVLSPDNGANNQGPVSPLGGV